MKSLCQIVVSIGFLSLSMTGCERHEFESTKVLHMEHGKSHEEHHDKGDHPQETHAKEAHAKPAVEAKPAVATPTAAPKPAEPVKTEEPRATGL